MLPTNGVVTRKATYAFAIVILLGSLVSCAKHKTYWLHLRPHATGEQGVTAKLTIGVLPFEDGRVITQKLGARVLSDGREEPIRLASSSASADVTNLLRRSLKARNIPVVTISQWDPTPQNLKDLPPEVDIAIAGKIEALEVTAQSTTLKSTLRYRVKLSAKLGLKAQGKVVTKSIEVRPEETVVRFERQRVEETLNEAVASALNGLIEAALASSS
jgi:hypothetical protein